MQCDTHTHTHRRACRLLLYLLASHFEKQIKLTLSKGINLRHAFTELCRKHPSNSPINPSVRYPFDEMFTNVVFCSCDMAIPKPTSLNRGILFCSVVILMYRTMEKEKCRTQAYFVVVVEWQPPNYLIYFLPKW